MDFIKRLIKEGSVLERMDFSLMFLEGINFEGYNLQEASFSGAKLYGANFSFCNLAGANFYIAYADNSKFCKSSIKGVNFAHSNLYAANFQGSNISESIFDCASCINTDFRGVDFSDARFVGGNCKFALFDRARMQYINFYRTYFHEDDRLVLLGYDYRGYQLFMFYEELIEDSGIFEIRFKCGCRDFSSEDALLHWKENPHILNRVVAGIQIAISKGWLKPLEVAASASTVTEEGFREEAA